LSSVRKFGAGLVALPRGSALRTLEALSSVRIEQSRTSGTTEKICIEDPKRY